MASSWIPQNCKNKHRKRAVSKTKDPKKIAAKLDDAYFTAEENYVNLILTSDTQEEARELIVEFGHAVNKIWSAFIERARKKLPM